VPQQVIQRTGLGVPREPRILEVALDQAATLQRASNASSDLLYQLLQVPRLGRLRKEGVSFALTPSLIGTSLDVPL
jgi:hypothetical protein